MVEQNNKDYRSSSGPKKKIIHNEHQVTIIKSLGETDRLRMFNKEKKRKREKANTHTGS